MLVALKRTGVPRCMLAAGCLAMPMALAAGIITVDSAVDGNAPLDPTITLREALLIARGDRPPFDLLEGDDEMARVSGPVGAGVADLIEVVLGAEVIALAAELPSLSDSTDSIDASSFTVVDGATLPGTSTVGLIVTTDGHSVSGLTLQAFSTGLGVLSADNSFDAMIVDDCRNGVVLFEGAENNDLSNFVVRGCTEDGVVVQSGGNDLSSFFVHGNHRHGLRFSGAAAQFNVLRSSAVGITELGAASGNQEWGIVVEAGASFNTFGDPASDSAFSDIANNELGGIKVQGEGTNLNLFHSMRIGYSSSNPNWNGNGSGPGILVTGGAADTLVGKQGANTLIAIGGHAASGIVVEGPLTGGTSIERVDVGGYEPLISGGNALDNEGHGIEIRDGADDTTVAGPMELRQVDVNHTGGHGIFVNGDNASDPIEGTVLGFYHIGDLGGPATYVIGGDAIRISGNVDGVVVGGAGHRNTTNSATGWGLHIAGPAVKNVELVRVVTGEGQLGSGTPNQLGGIYIGDGADGVTFRDAGANTRSFIHSNGGPGMMIDLSGTPPRNVAARNASFGVTQFGENPAPNAGGGIVVTGDGPVAPRQGDPVPVVADNVSIGDTTSTTPLVVSGNTGNGLLLRTVTGVKVANCHVGVDAAGNAARANGADGIRLEQAPNNEIGDPSVTNRRNVISGNNGAGIYLGDDSYDVAIRGNLIGTNAAGTAAIGNAVAGILVTDLVPPLEEGGELILGELRIGGASGVLGGGAGLGDGNLISGNPVGIIVDDRDGAVSNATIVGNLIGTNLAGTGAVPNTEAGIRVSGSNVGNTFLGEALFADLGNLVSGNGIHGIDISDAGEVRISNCLVGTNAAGTAAIAGQPVGVRMHNASAIHVGGNTENTKGNTISGNEQDGVLVEGSAANISIARNRIGTNKAGTAAVANGVGVRIARQQGDAISNVVVGGANPSVAAATAGDIGLGNVVSGNTQAGIRVEGDGAAFAHAPGAIRIEGNLIGTSASGAAPLANDVGIVAENHLGEGLLIGSEDDAARGNVISGNLQDGIRVTGAASRVVIARNRIGTGIDGESGVPNGKEGILFESAAADSIVRRNAIHRNLEHGIRIAAPDVARVRIENNSIHRNIKGGIEMADGANAGIAAPRLDRSKVGTFLLAGTTIPNGNVEVFADPTFTDDGIWGQGRDRVAEVVANGTGAFSLDVRTIEKKGIVTATVRDSDGNTSEFAAPFDVALVQTTAQTPEYLLAARPTAIRVLGDSGAGGDVHTLTGEATFAGSPAETDDKFVLRRRGYYDERPSEAAKGLASLDIIVAEPAAGSAAVEVVVREGTKERARIDAGSFEFREVMRDMSMLCVPAAVPVSDAGGAAKPAPSATDITSAGRFFAAVYPVDPEAFMAAGSFTIGATFERGKSLSNFGRWAKFSEQLEKMRTTTLRNGTPSRYVAGFVSAQSGLNDPSIPSGATARGAHFAATPNVALVLDKDARNKPNGESLCHEIGHAPPFLLSDTYAGGRTWDQKPAPALPSEVPHDSLGIQIPSSDRAFDPQAVWEDNACVHPGPVVSDGLRDFMGASSYGWVDPRTDRLLFDAAQKNATTGPPISGALMIAGTLDDDGTGEIAPLYHATGEQTPLPSTSDDPFTVELLDAGDQVLASREFDAAFSVELLGEDASETPIPHYAASSTVPFAVPMQDDPSAAKVRIRQGNETVAERTRSANFPTVELLAPHGPDAPPAGDITVTWTADDIDPGDAANLTFDVFFTPDGGFSRFPIAVNEIVTSIEVDPATLPGGSGCRFIVRASDGWNASEAQSEPAFTLADGTPDVAIDFPTASDPVETGVPVALSGSAWDAEDGVLQGPALEWTVDGVPVGDGLAVVTTLAAGSRTIRLTATDSAAGSAFAEVVVDVSEPAAPVVESGWWAVMGAGAP